MTNWKRYLHYTIYKTFNMPRKIWTKDIIGNLHTYTHTLAYYMCMCVSTYAYTYAHTEIINMKIHSSIGN